MCGCGGMACPSELYCSLASVQLAQGKARIILRTPMSTARRMLSEASCSKRQRHRAEIRQVSSSRRVMKAAQYTSYQSKPARLVACRTRLYLGFNERTITERTPAFTLSDTATSKMDREPTYSLNVWGEDQSANGGDATNKQIQQQLVNFILQFQIDNTFPYRYISSVAGKAAVGADGL